MAKQQKPKVIGKIEIPEEKPAGIYTCETCNKDKHKREFNYIRWAIYECSECQWERESEEYRNELEWESQS